MFIPRISLSPSESLFPFRLRRRQFPIRPAFAMTINKSQGQTIKRVGLYLAKQVFSHGQLYVALSRSTSFSNITMYANPNDDSSKDVYTKNIVYPAALA